jgi:signal transduction histidine kinase
LYYLCYLLSFVGFVLLYLRGFHVFMGQTLSSFINMNGISFVAVTYMFAILFSTSFLNGKVHAPRLTRVLHWLIWLLWIPVIFNLAGYRPGAIKILEYCSFLLPFSFIYIAIKALRKKYRPARYFLFAWTVLLLSMMLFATANMGFVHFGFWTFHILPIASAFEMSFLSLALGHRYADLKREKIELQKINLEQVEKEVQERTKELKESNHVKDKMLGIISHDLRAPLNNLSGLLDLVELKALSAGEIQDFSLTVRQNIKHITGTMNNMLNWSLSQMNRIETRPQKIILYPFILQIIETYWYATDQKNIHMKADIPEGIVVFADFNQLNLIIRNLLDNAIKFTPKGGMIIVGCRPAAKLVELYVQDNGLGMQTEEVEKLLSENSFYSTDGTEEEKGTGLGLQLCKEFISRNGGSLRIDTAPGKGAEFSFCIPRV